VAVIPSLSRDLGLVPSAGRRDSAEMFRLRRSAPSLNMTDMVHPVFLLFPVFLLNGCFSLQPKCR
jgi:hypothetical protein